MGMLDRRAWQQYIDLPTDLYISVIEVSCFNDVRKVTNRCSALSTNVNSKKSDGLHKIKAIFLPTTFIIIIFILYLCYIILLVSGFIGLLLVAKTLNKGMHCIIITRVTTAHFMEQSISRSGNSF